MNFRDNFDKLNEDYDIPFELAKVDESTRWSSLHVVPQLSQGWPVGLTIQEENR